MFLRRREKAAAGAAPNWKGSDLGVEKNNSKKILVVDDSALMRRIFCDIINGEQRFHVADTAANGREALKLLQNNTYDLILLDLTMPVMDGISFMKEMNRLGNKTKIVIISTLVSQGADVTLEALSLGAVDFVKKPGGIFDVRGEKFSSMLIRILSDVLLPDENRQDFDRGHGREEAVVSKVTAKLSETGNKKTLVAIASSTGGPKALHEVLSGLPDGLNAPVLVVQHMPDGFTATLSERLDSICALHVQEASEDADIRKGNIYIARGGTHMTAARKGGSDRIAFLDKPPREGVKPCANYMYESLKDCSYERIVCVVLTGMGADGTQGIANLKEHKELYVIAQDQESCAVYGMPRCVVAAGLANEVVPLDKVADAIIKNVGVSKDGC